MSSRSATVLVIFSVAVIAFCLASVFASMTGPISILPNESDNGGILDNLSALTDQDNNNYQSYGYDDSDDYSSSYSNSHSDDKKVETTTDDSHTNDDNNKDDSQIETTTDNGQSDSDRGSTKVDSKGG